MYKHLLICMLYVLAASVTTVLVLVPEDVYYKAMIGSLTIMCFIFAGKHLYKAVRIGEQHWK